MGEEDFVFQYSLSNESNTDFFVRHIASIVDSRNDLCIYGESYQNAPMDKLCDFWDSFYEKNGQEYLKRSKATVGDCQYTRSFYFWLEQNAQVVAALRITPYPFEINTAVDDAYQVGVEYDQYIELSRLVVTAGADSRLVTLKLMAAACQHILNGKHAGIVAMCRFAQRRLFERVGLRAIHQTSIRLEKRNSGEYWLMAGSIEDICSTVVAGNKVQIISR